MYHQERVLTERKKGNVVMDSSPSYQWTPERQIGYPQILEVAPAPDGHTVAYVVREPLLTEERSEFISHLYLARLDGSEPVQLTFGPHSNSKPCWSPDGRVIAFLSMRAGKANLWAMRPSGGEAWALTQFEKSAISTLKWSPNGTRIAFLMTEPATEEQERLRKAKDDVELFDQDFDFTHLFIVPFAVGPRTLAEPQQVTAGRFQVVDFDWLLDGERLVISHRPTPVADCWPETYLALLSASSRTEQPTATTVIGTRTSTVHISPNGQWIACPTSDKPAHWATSNRIVIYPIAGGEPRPLAATVDIQSEVVGWSANGREVYVWDWTGVTTQLWALPISGEAPRPLTEGPLLKTMAVANQQGQIAFIGQDFEQPNAVYLLEAASGKIKMVVQPALPAEWPTAPLPQAEVLRWRGPDGLTIEGILTYPIGYQPGRSYPLIVMVHGGPTGVFVRNYLGVPTEYAHLTGLAEHGYAVLRPNPRGSSGYGRDFRFANYKDWGGKDFQDILAGVEALIGRGIANAEKLGIMGWSYGGFMTSWAVTQTDRFKAACVGAAVTNLISFNGTTDIPSFLPDYFGAEYWRDPEIYRLHSPAMQAGSVHTPCLIQHGANDVRVPLSQGREFHNALKRQGVPVELVVYPRQDHLFSEPRMIMDRMRRSTAWFDRWIGGDPAC